MSVAPGQSLPVAGWTFPGLGHPVKFPTDINFNPGARASSATEFIQLKVNALLQLREPKQDVDQVMKSLLYLHTRDSHIHPSEYEVTPSTTELKIAPRDELNYRSDSIAIATQLVEHLGKETRRGLVDEPFCSLKFPIIYTATNFINAFYNCHVVNSVDQLELVITAVFLACKAQSTFKRLEKVIGMANQCFSKRVKYERAYFAQVEMAILQSIGFELTIAEDIPHRYIYQFMPVMSEKYVHFKANEKEMKTLCSCALSLTSSLVKATPIMINRESSHIAAACIFISNKFRPVLNIDSWWKTIPGCDDLSIKVLTDLSDLIYDALKYSRNQWKSDAPNMSSPVRQPVQFACINKMQTLPTSPTLLQKTLKNEKCDSGTWDCDSVSSGGENQSKSLPGGVKIQYSSSNTSTCSSEATSLGSTGFGHRKSIGEFTRQFSKPEQIPKHIRRKSTGAYQPQPPSPLTKRLNPEEYLHLQYRKRSSSPRPPPQAASNVPSITSTILTSIPQSPPPPPPPSDVAKRGRINSSASSVASDSSFASTSTNASLGGASHPREIYYATRKEAILNNEEIALFYAKSTDRYKTLDREEKNVVKVLAKKLKHNKSTKSFLERQVRVDKKRKRKSCSDLECRKKIKN